MSLPTGRRKGSCSLWLKRNWVLMSLVGLALASAALSVLLCPVHKSNVALFRTPLTCSTAWRCGSRTACLDGAKKGCRVSFFMVLGCFRGETGSVCCRVCCMALSGYYGLSLSVGLLRVVAHVPNQHGRVVPEHPAHWLICAQVVPRALRQEDDLRHAQYDGRRQRDELRERLISRERTTAAWHSNSTPDAVDASTAYQYLDAAAMACPGAGHGLRDGN